jgi:hypothetical protein
MAPYFVSQYHICIDFSNTGEIGDTICRITTPFIGVLSIIILYLTLQSQRQENEKGTITLLCNHLIKCIDNFHYTEEEKSIEKKGAEAIASYLNWLYCDAHKSYDELKCNAIASEFINILDICNSCNELLDKANIQDKRAFEILIANQFEYRIYPEIKKHIGDKDIDSLGKHFCNECGIEHGFDKKTLKLIKKLIRKLIKNTL